MTTHDDGLEERLAQVAHDSTPCVKKWKECREFHKQAGILSHNQHYENIGVAIAEITRNEISLAVAARTEAVGLVITNYLDALVVDELEAASAAKALRVLILKLTTADDARALGILRTKAAQEAYDEMERVEPCGHLFANIQPNGCVVCAELKRVGLKARLDEAKGRANRWPPLGAVQSAPALRDWIYERAHEQQQRLAALERELESRK